MDKKSKSLLAILSLLALTSIGFTYYHFMVKKSYTVEYSEEVEEDTIGDEQNEEMPADVQTFE